MKYTVHFGVRYKAHIELGGFEALADNDAIEARLHNAGFTDIVVRGQGKHRVAEATWLNDDRSAELPNEIVLIEIVNTGKGKAI